ncbi:MAG: hypothetical protein K6G83_06425 [Lachnospiraceae bacterium]|nr:hypothetical protein [Lachnospiraceae bacterium]
MRSVTINLPDKPEPLANSLAQELAAALRKRRDSKQLQAGQCLSFFLTGSGDGDDSITLSLAKILSEEENCRTLLLDARMDGEASSSGRREERNSFNGKPVYGLSDLLSGQKKMDEVLLTTQTPSLFFMAAGQVAEGGTALLKSPYFGKLLEAFRNRFDFLLICGTPAEVPVICPACQAAVILAGDPIEALSLKQTLTWGDCPVIVRVLSHGDQEEEKRSDLRGARPFMRDRREGSQISEDPEERDRAVYGSRRVSFWIPLLEAVIIVLLLLAVLGLRGRILRLESAAPSETVIEKEETVIPPAVELEEPKEPEVPAPAESVSKTPEEPALSYLEDLYSDTVIDTLLRMDERQKLGELLMSPAPDLSEEALQEFMIDNCPAGFVIESGRTDDMEEWSILSEEETGIPLLFLPAEEMSLSQAAASGYTVFPISPRAADASGLMLDAVEKNMLPVFTGSVKTLHQNQAVEGAFVLAEAEEASEIVDSIRQGHHDIYLVTDFDGILQGLTELLAAGELSERELNTAAGHVLSLKFALADMRR